MQSEQEVETSHAKIFVRQTRPDGFPVLMIHGNSSSSAVFKKQFAHSFDDRLRLIALDLPGHGRSSNAFDPERTYNIPAYASVVAEVLDVLKIKRLAVFGWSLGGHVGLELLALVPGITGLMITGTPPVCTADIAKGFRMGATMSAAGTEQLSVPVMIAHAQCACGEPYREELYEQFLYDDVARTDGRARALMLAKYMSGYGADHSAIVAGNTPPIAIVNGASEPVVNTQFVEGILVANLWERKKFLIENGSGHAPFWDSPDDFNTIFERFLISVS